MNKTRMKILGKLSLLAFVPLFAVMVACNTTQQRIAANTLSATHDLVQTGVEEYYVATAKGLASTNGIVPVGSAYNKFQKVYVAAVDFAQNNTNALAPANVLEEASDVAAVIGQFYKPAADKITAKIKPQ